MCDFEQRAVIKFFVNCGETNNSIHQWLTRGFGDGAYSLRTVERWAARFRAGRESLGDEPREGRPLDPAIPGLVSKELEDNPNSSTRRLAETLNLSVDTVYRVITQILGMRYFKCRWIPHELSPDQKHQRKVISTELFAILDRMTETQLSHVITEDESWFHLTNPVIGQWRVCQEDVEQNITPSIGAEKVLVSVFWSIRGFHVVEALPDGETFTSEYMCETLIPKLRDSLSATRPVAGLNGLWLHCDNAKPHVSRLTNQTLSSHRMKRLQHPPYSPDLAPSDFYLFGMVKAKLAGRGFGTKDEILEEIRKIVDSVPKSELISVMNEWKRRLHAVSETDGGYITK